MIIESYGQRMQNPEGVILFVAGYKTWSMA